ncbi:MAG: ABC transporter substrate-binding protein [Oscillospiraceae bacterium]|nr:ABC transporter substrate-binding protein [Oscillospiraceae bacterium]
MKNKLFIIISIVLTFALLLSSCSSKSKDERRKAIADALYKQTESGELPIEITPTEDASEPVANSFALCYSRSDTLNPYNCTSNLNASVATLMYDPLVRISPDYSLEYILADKIKITENRIRVDIKTNILFTDGTALQPSDIVYSFTKAAQETSRFRAQLLSVVSCKAEGNSVIFDLTSADKMGAYLLDFPIIKRNTDTSSKMPTGSGRYVYVEDAQLGTYLQANRWWFSNSTPKIKRILLLRLPTLESIINSVEIGTLGFYYTDLRSGTPARINASTVLVDLNNIVYLGVNTSNNLLSKIEVRRAISNALDRSDIITKAYNGRANPSTGLFTPRWADAALVQENSIFAERKLAEADISSLGFVNMGTDSIYADGNGVRLSFNLLVNKDNAPRLNAAHQIAEQLKHVGIEIKVQEATTLTYLNKVTSGDYQLYLGEFALTNNMNITPLIVEDSGFYKGPVPYATQKAFHDWRTGEAELAELIETFNNELPFIPVCYRMGIACYTRTLSGDIKSTEDDPFYNVQEWAANK